MKSTRFYKYAGVCLAALLPVALLAGLFSRDETMKFHRDNPVDQRATNYQGSESVDADGDGEADFVVKLNGGKSNTTSRQVTLSVTGPRVRKTLISEDRSFAGALPQDSQAQYTYTLSTNFGLKTVYLQFEFTGGKKSKTYSNQITLSMTSNELAWLSSTFTVTLDGGATFTTNSNVTVTVTAPAQAVEMRYGETANMTTPWVVFNVTGTHTFLTNLTNLGMRPMWVQFRNSLGQIAAASNSIVYLPWRGFSLTLDNGAAVATNTNCMAQLNYPISTSKMRLACDKEFSVNPSGWIGAEKNISYTLRGTNSTYVLYAQFTNEMYGVSSAVISNVIHAPSGASGFFSINAGSNTTQSPNLLLQVTASGVQYMRFSESTTSLGTKSWIPYSNQLAYVHDAQGATNRIWLFGQFSNSVFNTISTIVSNSILPDVKMSLSATLSNGLSYSYSTNVVLKTISANIDFYRISSSADFSTGTGWISTNLFLPFSLFADGTTKDKVIYLQGSNSIWKTLTAMVQTKVAVPPVAGNVSFVSADSWALSSTNVLVKYEGDPSQYYCYFTNDTQSWKSDWVPGATSSFIRYVADGSLTPKLLYGCISNDQWKILSSTNAFTYNVYGLPVSEFYLDEGAEFATNSNCYAGFLTGRADYFRLGTNSAFTGSPFLPISIAQSDYELDFRTNVKYSLQLDANYNPMKVWFEISNSIWKNSIKAFRQIAKPVVTNTSPCISGGTRHTTNSNETIHCSNAAINMVRITTNPSFDGSITWVPSSEPVPIRLKPGTNFVLVQGTNTCFSSGSGITTNLYFYNTNVTQGLVGPEMIQLPGGSFLQGDAGTGPVRTNIISPFSISIFEITGSKYKEVLDWGKSSGFVFSENFISRPDRTPVNTVTWPDMLVWCNALSLMEGRDPAYYTDSSLSIVLSNASDTAWFSNYSSRFVIWKSNGYRLPTEAEWEYAAKGGVNAKNYWENGFAVDYVWSDPWEDGNPQPVGQKWPNGFGLYDCLGNVSEMVFDTFYPYPSTNEYDPKGCDMPGTRVTRGGGRMDEATTLTTTTRYDGSYGYGFGFRVVIGMPK